MRRVQTQQEIAAEHERVALELERAAALRVPPRVKPEEVRSLLDVVLARTRAQAATASRELADAARKLSSISSTGLRRVG